MRVWHAMWLQRIDTKIAALQEREAEQEQGRRNRPAEPDWVVELGIGKGRPPIQVHVGGCHAAGKRRPTATASRTPRCRSSTYPPARPSPPRCADRNPAPSSLRLSSR
ncbi:DUF6233 domain-containing protein [Streptomyces sp. NPDC005141]